MSGGASFAGLAALFGFTPVGVCPACRSLIGLTADGNIEAHSISRFGHNPCDGAGQPPLLSDQAAAPANERKIFHARK